MNRGEHEQLENAWVNTTAATSLNGALYAVTNGGLYRIDATGAYEQLEGSWSATTSMAAAKGRLFAMDNGILYDIDPATGAYEEVCNGWSTQHLVAVGDVLYAFETGGGLYRIAV
jgi:hypothetical protein